MEKPIKTFKKGNEILEIYQDENPESPRTWDNLGTMVCFHNRYNLGDDKKLHNLSKNDFNSWLELQNHIAKKLDAAVILPLFLYDHSGITMKTSPFDCRWDSGQVGFIFVTKKQARENFSKKRVSDSLKKKLITYLEGEVETYDQYLTGEMYGFKLSTVSTCDQGHEHKEETDSCWGFYGDNWEKNGLFDHVDGKFEEWVEVK